MILIPLAAALLLAPLTHHHHHLQPFAQAQAAPARTDKENEVKLILHHIEKETLKFRDEIERAYDERCNTETLSHCQCSKSNFNACSFVFPIPNQQCMKADELVIEACGDGGGGSCCNTLWDKATSSVVSAHLARGVVDPEVIETACYTLLAEDYMRTKYVLKKRPNTSWCMHNYHQVKIDYAYLLLSICRLLCQLLRQ
jgi:hypothetical protein